MKLRKCKSCDRYTLQDRCPGCGEDTSRPGPGPFSPEDKYGRYRREEKLKKETG